MLFFGLPDSKFLLTAPFTAALGWNFADRIAALEPQWLKNCGGLLLMSEVRKIA